MTEPTMTKAAFLKAYEEALLAEPSYDWAKDDAKRAKFLHTVSLTISGFATTWNHNGTAVKVAWKAIGGKGKPSLTGLRRLS